MPKRIGRLLVGVGLLLLLLPPLVKALNLLQNDGLEAPFVKYGEWSAQGVTFDLEVAHAWQRFYIPTDPGDDGSKLRYFKASALEFLFGFTEKRDGQDAQLFWSTRPFDAGIYQQVTGLTVGEYYGFQAGILQIYGNSTSQTNFKMFRQVGLDPTGGTDPTAAIVVWGPEEGYDVAWFYPGVGAQALASTMTVFVRVKSLEDSPQFEENSVWVDDTFLDIAPTTILNLTLDSLDQVTANWAGEPRSGFSLFAYEAQYRSAADSTWTDLQIFSSSTGPSTNSSLAFNIVPGQEYVVRARTWHEQISGDSHEVPGPWTEATIISGGFVQGRVLDNRARPISGVTVAVAGAPQLTTTSSANGHYTQVTGSGEFGLTAVIGNGWQMPQPIHVSVPTLASVSALTLTLRPPDDIIKNGDFVNELSYWQAGQPNPAISTTEFRSGGRSLQLTGTQTISQTGLISDSYRPTLSFWYKFEDADQPGTLTVEILGSGLVGVNSLSPASSTEWQFAWLPLDLTEVYTGPIGARFSLSQTGGLSPSVVYLDEVSLGAAWGGPQTVYLPHILK